MGKFHALVFNYGDLTFNITVSRYFRPNSGHSDERVYRKPIDRRLRTGQGVEQFSRTNHFRVMEVLSPAVFWIRSKHKYKIFEKFFVKKSQSKSFYNLQKVLKSTTIQVL